MIVYRICKKEEYDQIFSNKCFCDVGHYFKNDETKTVNTHNYKENTRYLHFFKDLNTSISYLAIVEGTYVCKYDIPDEVLKQNEGLGFYIDINNYHSHEAIEYAIESSKIKFDYLKQIIFITEYVSPQKVYEGAKIMDFGKMVYDLTKEPFDNQSHDIDLSIEDIIRLLPKSQNESVDLNDIFNKNLLDYKLCDESSKLKKLVK